MNDVQVQKNHVAKPATRVFNPILLYINENCIISFSKVFMFTGSDNTYVAHLKIWDMNAPFYFVFNNSQMQSLKIKGYPKNCMFIPNMFYLKEDKNGKLCLHASDKHVNCSVNYHITQSVSDIRQLVKIRQNNKHVYFGSEPRTKHGRLPVIGYAFELVIK